MSVTAAAVATGGAVEGMKMSAETVVCSKAGMFSSSIGFSGGRVAVVIMLILCWLASLLKAEIFSCSIDLSEGWVAAAVLCATVTVDDVEEGTKRLAESMCWKAGLFSSSIGLTGSRLS